ncbi:MAG: hypothetical protein P1P89_04375 [Desulfobacterales bacterium]|nr:hypothetical protein [Desulfobacterales bacterium]
MKKIWEKPKLVVLYRGKPEESVLAACKADVGGSVGAEFSKCRNKPPKPGPCSVQAVS